MTPDEKIDRGQTMEEMWEGFRQKVIPPDAGDAQVFDMKGAFFAGGLCLFQWLTATNLDDGDEISDREVQAMEAMHDELHGFFEKMAPRRQKN